MKSEAFEKQPPELIKALRGAALPEDSLSGASQLILAAAFCSDAVVCCYSRDETGGWHLNEHIGLVFGHVGKNGVRSDKTEGDGCTPAGLYSLGYAFGTKDKSDTAMDFYDVTENSYWVDDPASPYYNRWIESADYFEWTTAEHLADYQISYAYAVVIRYNMSPAVPGKGSAVFLHCGTEPTSGCIAVPEDDMLRILAWLDPEKKPAILIV
jgi:L,D-peptidoglycan transpeptidase YkuD (ErfK/YbiS/YcfS/YnhG family)